MDERIHDLTAAYALDALDAEERASYEAHLATCSACQDELASFWDVTDGLARGTVGPVPAEALRERILVRARAERPNVVPLRPRPWLAPVLGGVAAAAAVAALALGVWAASLSGELDDARSVADVLGDPQARTIALRGVDGRLVVTDEGEAVLVVDGLDPPPRGKAYEIWVVQNGRPDRAGLFADENVVPLERTVPPGVAVAVTLEDDEGVERPTGDPLFTAQA